MQGRRLSAFLGGLLLVLVLIGANHPAGLTDLAHPVAQPRTATEARPAQPQAPRAPFEGMLLGYAFHGFTADELARVRRAVPGTVAVVTGEVAVASGRPSYPVVPVEAMTADPTEYAAAAGDPALAAHLRTGAVLARGEAGLRHLAVGQQLALADGHSLPVTAVVDDVVLGGNEMALPPQYLPRRAGTAASYVLLPAGPSTAERVRAAMGHRTVRVKAHTANGFLSADDTVLTQLQVKERFGEFALRPRSDGSGFDQDPAYERHWLVNDQHVQQLGAVTCNKAVMPALRAAMKEITDRGLGATIDTADFQYEGGCWNPSVVPLSGGSMSRHSWGIAVDINVAANDLGGTPHQDPRLVAIMAKHGFAWGGEFTRPDGMHFEYVGEPAG